MHDVASEVTSDVLVYELTIVQHLTRKLPDFSFCTKLTNTQVQGAAATAFKAPLLLWHLHLQMSAHRPNPEERQLSYVLAVENGPLGSEHLAIYIPAYIILVKSRVYL